MLATPPMRPRSILLLAIVGAEAAATMLALSCSTPRLPEPVFVQQPSTALVEVPYPPPPARPETIPKQPTPDSVWIDGEWLWQVRRYAWKAGRWVVPPPNAQFSPWTATRSADGTMFLAAGAWRGDGGVEVEEPASRTPEPGEPDGGEDGGNETRVLDAAAGSTIVADASEDAEAGA